MQSYEQCMRTNMGVTRNYEWSKKVCDQQVEQGLISPPVYAVPSLNDFPTSEEDMSQFFVFSPFVTPVGQYDLEMLLILLGVVKLAKSPEGLKVLRDIAVEYLKTVGHVLGELEASSASNWLVAIINQRMATKVYRRMGLISEAEAKDLDGTYAWIFKLTLAKEGIVESLGGISSLARSVGGILGGGGGADIAGLAKAMAGK